MRTIKLFFLATLLFCATISVAQYKYTTKYINLATATSPVALNVTSDVGVVFASGTKSLSSNFEITVTGSPSDGRNFIVFWDGTAVTLNGNDVTVFGKQFRDEQATAKMMVWAIYRGNLAVWDVRVFQDMNAYHWVTKTNLALDIFDEATITFDTVGGVKVKDGGITNPQVGASAAIAYSKLNLVDAILAADINASAGIPYSKLSLTNSLLAADIFATANIPYSKLLLTNSLLNADINSSAAIAYSKLNLANSILASDINAAAAIPYSKLLLTGTLLNADIATGAVIGWNKMALLTASKALVSDGSGYVTTSVTATELGYLSGATSNIQTQITAASAAATYTKSSAATIVLDGTATEVYILNCTANNIALTLPAASDFPANHSIQFMKKFSGGAFNIVISPAGADLLEDTAATDVASITMGAATGSTLRLVTNGVDHWYSY